MKVLLINGSPHKTGCTFTALSEVAKALNGEGIDTSIQHIGTQQIMGCIACRKCLESGLCFFKNDPVNDCIRQLKEADGLVVGSPIYYAGPNGALCALLDRIFFCKSNSYAFKPAAAVVSCRRGGATSGLDRLNKYFSISQMPVVSSRYWNMVHGNSPEEVLKDEEGIQTMRILGRNMAWLIKSIAAAKIPLPKQEEQIWTNFIR